MNFKKVEQTFISILITIMLTAFIGCNSSDSDLASSDSDSTDSDTNQGSETFENFEAPESFFSADEGWVGHTVGENLNQVLFSMSLAQEYEPNDDFDLPSEDLALARISWKAGQDKIQEFQVLLDSLNKGEEVEVIYEFDGNPDTQEKITLTRDHLIVWDYLMNDYQEESDLLVPDFYSSNSSQQAAIAATITSKSLIAFDPYNLYNVNLVCKSYRDLGDISKKVAKKLAESCSFEDEIIDNPFYQEPANTEEAIKNTYYNEPELNLGPKFNPLECGGYILNSFFQQIMALGQIGCMPFPTHLDKLNLYPERPCIKIDPDRLHSDDRTIKLVLEGEHSNEVDSVMVIEQIIGVVVSNNLGGLFKGLDLPSSIKETIFNFAGNEISSALSSKAEDEGLDASKLKFNAGITGVSIPVDPNLIDWLINGELFGSESASITLLQYEIFNEIDSLTNIPAYYLMDKWIAGRELTLQASISTVSYDGEDSSTEIIKSQIRNLRSSTPPTLVKFNMPNEILGDVWRFNYDPTDADQQQAVEDWFHNPDLQSGEIDIEDEDKDLLWAYFIDDNGQLGAKGFIYGEQTDERIDLDYQASYDLLSTIPGPGSKSLSLVARDLCGNQVLLKSRHNFNWDTCPSDIIDCFLASEGDQWINNGYTISGGLDKSNGKPSFDKAIDDYGLYGGNGPSNLINLVDENGLMFFGGRSWIDILKEQDLEYGL